MPRPKVNAEEAKRLHQAGWQVTRIACHFDVQPPAIWRQFAKIGYRTPSQIEGQKRAVDKAKRQHRAQLKVARAWNGSGRPRKEVDTAPPAPANLPDARTCCFRCGVRSDIGCKHSNRPPLGWSV